MFKSFLVPLLFSFTFLATAQKTLTQELDSIFTIEQAQQFLDSKKARHNKIITYNEEKHKTKFAQELLNLSKGGSIIVKNELEKIHYKVIEKNKIVYQRVNYIFLDGKEKTISEINRLRPRIIAKLKNGVPFKDVAMEYSMDKNKTRGGDSGWFTYGEMQPEFEQQVMNDTHEIDDIFLVDIDTDKLYYVVKNSHNKKNITEVKVLKVTERIK